MRNLDQWLDYQQRVHPRSIELGLGRVAEVWRRLGSPRPAPVVVTIGGTNGKGSTVAFLEAMLAAAGRRVGCYTSPHLLRYNERVRVAGADAGDADLIDAFERIETLRAEVPLTYFEFGTLAAIEVFARSGLDVVVLEVGLGGRLDAVNIVDADAAIVTAVGLDHQDWLGNDLDSIGGEKAGIFRAGRPAVIGMRAPPEGLLAEAARIGARTIRAGIDYEVEHAPGAWRWRGAGCVVELPLPSLAAACQVDNAAAAIAALHALRDRLGWNPPALAAGVRDAFVPARLQRFTAPGAAELVIDVAHNPQAAATLAQWLGDNPVAGRTFAVFGALDDKDAGGIAALLRDRIDVWLLAGLDRVSPRGVDAASLRDRIGAMAATVAIHDGPEAALRAARTRAGTVDRVVAFGSFHVAAAALSAQRAGDWAGVNVAARLPQV